MGCRFSKPTVDTIYKPVDIYHFKIIKAIGKGTFGKVCLVEFVLDDNRYALKYTSKEQAIKDKAVQFILQERRILEGLEHPYICHLRFSFQDDSFMYMILDYKEGCDLRKSMKNRKWTEDETRIVIAEIASALEYLHRNNIVHRDLKPDNILLDSIGHAYLSDFNIATVLKDEPLTSVAGTEPYMAPELISGNGYMCSVDWWSLGVILFEMVCGERPFRSKNRKKLIKKGIFKFPPTVQLSDSIKNAISGFLRMDAHTRLGVGFEGMMALKCHAYFSKIRWLDLKFKGVTPIYVPEVEQEAIAAENQKPDICINDLLLLLEKPKKQRKLSKITSEDLRKIYHGFDYFDHRRPHIEDPIIFETRHEDSSTFPFGRSGASSADSGDWIIKAKNSIGSFMRASSFKTTTIGSKFSSISPNQANPNQAFGANITTSSLLGPPNLNPSTNAITAEKLKRRHSISMVDSQRAAMFMIPPVIANTPSPNVLLPNPSQPINNETLPKASQFIIQEPLANSNTNTPQQNINRLIPEGVQVVDNLIKSNLPNQKTELGSQFRRRHSVSGPNAFTRQDLLVTPMIGTIEERRSIIMDKSTFLDKE